MKIYRHGDTYIAPRGSYFDGNVKIDGNFIASPGTQIWGNVVVTGSFELGPHSMVGGSIDAKKIIVGCNVRIKGPLNVLESATICDNADLYSIQAGGDVILRPGVRVGDVNSKETIFIFGKVSSDRLLGRAVKVYKA